MPHLIAAAVFNGVPAFEYSVAREVLGRDRSELTPAWYRFLSCRVAPGQVLTSHDLEIHPEGELEDLASADTILIPGWNQILERPNDAFLEALLAAHQRGARLVSICTGAFALAHAGLLDQRRATTHWLHAAKMREHFPKVLLEDNALYTRDHSGSGPIFTSAGAAAGLDLCLALIREDFGVAVANAVARRMVAPVHRDGGQSQYVEAPKGTTDDEIFGPALHWLNERISEPLVINDAAQNLGYSLRTFQRRFKQLTSLSPHQWVTQQRVARARELLEGSDLSVEQIATQSGLGSAANLRKQLARCLGTTPRAYRSAFRAQA